MRAALLLLWPALIYAQNGTPKFAVLHGFSGENGDGAYPGGALLIGANGALYGTTARGGNANGISGVGMVFELTPPSSPGGAWTAFASDGDGVQPNAGFVAGPDGSYYSTTYGGGGGQGCLGYGGCGTVHELTPPATAGGCSARPARYSAPLREARYRAPVRA